MEKSFKICKKPLFSSLSFYGTASVEFNQFFFFALNLKHQHFHTQAAKMNRRSHVCKLEWVSGNPCDATYECRQCIEEEATERRKRLLTAADSKGTLIVVEGIDGSGKETQTRLLVDWLKHTLGKQVSTFDFPSYHRSPFGRIIGRYLKGEFGDPVQMDPFETALLYAGDRMHSKIELLDALSKGHTVVLNRYVPSNLAYGCAKLRLLNRSDERDKLVSFNRQIEYEAAGLPEPDLVLVLDVHVVVASSLINSKAPRQYLEGEERDKYEMDTHFQRCVREEYLRLAVKSKSWHIIDCSEASDGRPRSIEAIQNDLREKITHQQETHQQEN